MTTTCEYCGSEVTEEQLWLHNIKEWRLPGDDKHWINWAIGCVSSALNNLNGPDIEYVERAGAAVRWLHSSDVVPERLDGDTESLLWSAIRHLSSAYTLAKVDKHPLFMAESALFSVWLQLREDS